MSEQNLNVESVGHLSARCNVPLHRVLRAVDTLGIAPALVVDDVAHLSEHDAQRVAAALAQVGAQEPKIAGRAAPRIQAKHRGRATPR
jgi:hypothetical protein